MDATCGLTIQSRNIGVKRIISISGQLDQESVPALRYALNTEIDHGNTGFTIVDLTSQHMIDSAILAVLIQAKRRATAQGCNFWFLVDPSTSLHRILDAANLLNYLGVTYELDELGPRPRSRHTASRGTQLSTV